MTSIALPDFRLSDTRLASLGRGIRTGSPMLFNATLALLAGFVICLVLPLADDRLFNGINVWHKPAKFFFSLAVQLATVSWALSLVGKDIRAWRSVRWSIAAMIGAAFLEMAYIVYRASQAEASHYNLGTPLARALYSLMGAGAVTLTATAALIGLVIWLNRKGDIWREAAGIGLMLGNVLATVVAFPLAAGTSHWIGGDQTDATGLPLFFWSTTGGDLRVAHFIALHAAQAVPFAALSGRRSLVWLTALAIVAATAATFFQAMMGMPLFKV